MVISVLSNNLSYTSDKISYDTPSNNWSSGRTVGDFAIDTHKISHQSVDPSDPDETPVIDQGNLSPILMLPDRRKLLAILRIDRTKYSIHNVGE